MILYPGGLFGIGGQQRNAFQPLFLCVKQVALLFQHLCGGGKLLQFLRVYERMALLAHQRAI